MLDLDKTICVFCGQNNHCMAGQAENCWCFDTDIPKALLELVPQMLVRKTCICLVCVNSFKQNEQAFKIRVNL